MNKYDPTKILLLSANPQDTVRLRLDEEMQEIRNRLRQVDQFTVELRWAVRPRDIQRAMLDVNPEIVHFSGHGTLNEGLIFEDEAGRSQSVSASALAQLF